MLQTIEAVIDSKGNVHLMEKVSITETRRALVTILDEVKNNSDANSESIVGSAELLTDDLETDSKEISQMFNDALLKSGENLGR